MACCGQCNANRAQVIHGQQSGEVALHVPVGYAREIGRFSEIRTYGLKIHGMDGSSGHIFLYFLDKVRFAFLWNSYRLMIEYSVPRNQAQ